jgi:hypothetical protein
VGGVKKEDDMADEERVGQDGAHDADVARLPVPLSDRRPAVRPADVVPVDRADAVVRAVSSAPLLAPMVAAAVVTATAAAVVSGVAAASQWMWPWLAGRVPSAPKAPPSASWLGPGLHVSYTHIEVHWPLGR